MISSASGIQEKLLGRPVPAGTGGLRLVLPRDEGVLHPSQTARGFELVSDVQIYLARLAAVLGVDLDETVTTKLASNARR